MEEIYNLMAEIIYYFFENINSDFYQHYNNRTKKSIDNIKSSIAHEIPRLFCANGEGIAALEAPESVLCGINSVFLSCKGNKEFDKLLQLLIILDNSLEKQMRWEYESRQGNCFEGCLNENWKKYKIGLLPRCECCWERHHRGSQHYNRIDNFIQNFLIIDYRVWENWRIMHHFLTTSLMAKAEENKKLTVVISPYKTGDDFAVKKYISNEEQKFSVQYTGNAEADTDKVKRVIDLAAENRASIVIFPEMLGNATMEDAISDYLMEPSRQERGCSPDLILLPTIWSDHTNTACLLDGTGATICRQCKQYPYMLPDGYEEDIVPDRVIHLIHGEGIGRIVIMICRDFLTADYLSRVLTGLKTTLILIPSYSTGDHDFEQIFGKLLSEDCCAIWTNTCSVVKKQQREGKVGMVLQAGKVRVGIRERYKEFTCPGACEGQECTDPNIRICELYYDRDVS